LLRTFIRISRHSNSTCRITSCLFLTTPSINTFRSFKPDQSRKYSPNQNKPRIVEENECCDSHQKHFWLCYWANLGFGPGVQCLSCDARRRCQMMARRHRCPHFYNSQVQVSVYTSPRSATQSHLLTTSRRSAENIRRARMAPTQTLG